MTSMPPRLKWHKLRRRKSDPPFLRENLVDALKRGAACEIDLVLSADGHALCLHDLDLDRETTGKGPVLQASRSQIETLRQRGNNGAPLASPPLFLDEIVAAVRRIGAQGDGRVQLDIKAPSASFDRLAVERIARVLGETAPAFIASGYEWNTVQRFVAAAPGLRAGFDPLDFYPRSLRLNANEFRALAQRTLATAPDVSIYYLEAKLIIAGLDRGVDLVRAVTGGGAEVDAWTIDPDTPDLRALLQRLLEAGCRQITTNDPEALEPIIRELAPCS
jgi:glycerophosphoryl diester phosphodiesterase